MCNNFDYKEFLRTVPNKPGCYCMFDSKGTIIYVGKAKDLKKRLSSYFLKNVSSSKTQALVENICKIEVTVTFSETEALLLENNLIKQYQPKYNILLRDDKSYPYIFLSQSEHPGLFYHRGAKSKEGFYFGPYPDSSAVKESLKLLQKIFPIRQCTDNVYKNRTRPCLMYQLGKCLGPCVYKSQEDNQRYDIQVKSVKLFLQGKNQDLLNSLSEQMQEYSNNLDFENAAKIRDQLQALRRVQESQSVIDDHNYNIDVIGIYQQDNSYCVHMLYIRNGRILGSKSFFPKVSSNLFDNVYAVFLEQYYLSDLRDNSFCDEIILSEQIDNLEVLKEALYIKSNKQIQITINPRLQKGKYLRLANANAKAALLTKLASSSTAKTRIEALESLLKIKEIKHMECFDISHTQGDYTVGSCVVFNQHGPDTSRYKKYNIQGITKGDDYAAMHQVLSRRYRSIDKDNIPDVIFIDGGMGQLAQAEEVIKRAFDNANIPCPLIVSVAKGEGRKEGLETLIIGFSHEKINLNLDNPALQIVLHIRDESHRFAISAHRHKRQKNLTKSVFESIPGVGAQRRKALLKHLGGKQEVMRSGIDDLAKVPGISENLAKIIYEHLHS